MKIAVMGAGAVGCYYGGMLARAGHRVTLIGRQPHVDAFATSGLRFEGLKFDERVAVDSSTKAAAVRGAIGRCRRASATPMPAHSPCATRSMRQPRSAARRSRSALPTTDAELRLIASAAIIGDSSQPVNGYSSPAASGTPSAL